MKEKWTQEQVNHFNEMEPSDYANVVALAGGKIQRPEPEGLAAARAIAHLQERVVALEDYALRQAQALRDVMDESEDGRPDLEGLLGEGDRLLVVGGEV
ncbi:hypothetical protein ACH42_08450 [Endozoicomonas sp. (ex Bugula neritina AB1)]|nr:hypothetical protein ACH42_08450 [Endozoicomonas sp. (ex Bugula neritina AB1)]